MAALFINLKIDQQEKFDHESKMERIPYPTSWMWGVVDYCQWWQARCAGYELWNDPSNFDDKRSRCHRVQPGWGWAQLWQLVHLVWALYHEHVLLYPGSNLLILRSLFRYLLTRQIFIRHLLQSPSFGRHQQIASTAKRRIGCN